MKMKGIGPVFIVVLLLSLAGSFYLVKNPQMLTEALTGKSVVSPNAYQKPFLATTTTLKGVCVEGWVIAGSYPSWNCETDKCAVITENGKIISERPAWETQYQCNQALLEKEKQRVTTTTQRKICPQVCTALWELVPASGGYTCRFNLCGSGCGADSVNTFTSVDRCNEAARSMNQGS